MTREEDKLTFHRIAMRLLGALCDPVCKYLRMSPLFLLAAGLWLLSPVLAQADGLRDFHDAERAIAEQDFPKAIALLTSATESMHEIAMRFEGPPLYDLLILRTAAYLDIDDVEAADADINRLKQELSKINGKPKLHSQIEAEILNLRALVLAKRGDFDTSLALINHALKLRVNWPPYKNSQGLILIKRGEFKSAVDFLTKEISSRSDYWKYYVSRAQAFQKLDDEASMRSDLSTACRLITVGPFGHKNIDKSKISICQNGALQ